MAYTTNSFDEKVLSLLALGGVGFMPSDTVYGLSARALDSTAITKLHEIKDRSAHKPFIILISDLNMLDLLSINREDVKLVEPYWPDALTLICPAPTAPFWLHQGLQSLAIRIPNNVELLKLIDEAGPLISTSANIESQPTASSVDEAKKVFGDRLDFYVDKGMISGSPSTIAKITNNKLEVIRQGAVKIK